MSNKNQLPIIRQTKQVASSRLFAIEQLDLTFSNGEQRQYERMKGSGRGAVMIVPMLDNDTLLLVREYCAGTHNYQLGFPKGLIDEGEQAEQAANRELKEEIHYGSQKLTKISQVMMAPAFFNAKMDIFLAQDLFKASLPGDEPEPLELVSWPLADYKRLLQQEDFNEARSIAALMLVLDLLRG
ncbi:ADP compounds hydrolase NudE [Litorilituus sediminis]|uniref:ADP compounds hydrolase NudE n=1 Tax=Litorilituus sediminis TaxID=718192 RepID=A0A4V0ZGM1_9GAMM|nr:ADP compounds hydrolase NudE [Litorilituus sediminis]QBG37780.1 ADP compounds hydrolase NudE [Litorilituus sediminis]